MKAPKYELIPLGKIEPVARKIAVLWVEGFEKTGGIMLNDKHKLASDIMNYGRDYAMEFMLWTMTRRFELHSGRENDVVWTYWEDGFKKMDTAQVYAQFELERSQIAQNNKCVIPDVSNSVCPTCGEVRRIGECCVNPKCSANGY